MSILGTLGIIGGTTLASSALGMIGAKKDRDFQIEQAQKQMDFQKEMSNTSWQRGVEDIQKAGLNPALAYSQGGASSASGAMASGDGGNQRAITQAIQQMANIASTAILVNGRHNVFQPKSLSTHSASIYSKRKPDNINEIRF